MGDGKVEFIKAVQKSIHYMREFSGKGLLVTHYDTDGITSGFIMSTFMKRLGMDFDIKFVPFISHVNVDEIPGDYDYYVFTDIGAGQQKLLEKVIPEKAKVLIYDHHPYDYRVDRFKVVNPVDFGYDSQSEMCAAGLAYTVYRTAFGVDEKLLWIAIAGTVGDVQDADNDIIGLNREILMKDIERTEYIFYDPEVPRAPKLTIVPLWYTITYNYILKLPGLYLNRDATIEALSREGIDPFKNFLDLDPISRKKYTEFIRRNLEAHGENIVGKFGEFFNARFYPSDDLDRDAKAIVYHARTLAQYINMTGRLGKFDIAFKALEELSAKPLIEVEQESRELMNKLKHIAEMYEVHETGKVRYIVVDDVPPEFSGYIANVISTEGKIAIALVKDPSERYYKVSGRAAGKSPFHIGEFFRQISEKLGTDGGGHENAGGMILPTNKLSQFLKQIEF